MDSGARARSGKPFHIYAFAALLLATMLPAPAAALRIVGGSLSVSRSFDSGGTWYNVNPGDTITIGDWFRITMTLEDNSGLLGNLCADPGSPPGIGVPQPNAMTCGFGADGFDGLIENNGNMASGIWGQWPGQYWVWPVTGDCLKQGLYPDPVGSPVGLIAVEPVTTFAYNGVFLGTVEAYDPAGDVWTTKASMPTPRARLGVVAVGNIIYAIGGRSAAGLSPAVEAYDPTTDAWAAKAPMPTPREGLAVAVGNGKIYAIGGRGDGGAVLNVVEEYNPGTNTWATKMPCPTPRYGIAAATLAPFGSDLIYVPGGLDGSWGGLSAAFEIYDVSLNTWSTPAPSPAFTLRGDFAAASDGSYVWAAGGWDWASVDPYMEGYDPVLDGWNTGGFMNEPRSRLAMAAVGGKLYAVGGVQNFGVLIDRAPDSSVNNEEYDPGGGAWATKANMPTPRTWLGAAAGNDGVLDRVYAVGGFTGLQYTDVNVAYGQPNNTARVSWTFVARTEWPSLDFTVFAADQDDTDFASPAGSWEGSYFDCSIPPSGGYQGDSTLQQVFTDSWGGTLNIVSQFKCSSRAVVSGAGTRPANVAYLGDSVQVQTTITNTGAAATLNGIDACCAYHPYGPIDPPNGAPSPPKGNVCIVPATPPGACSVNNSQPSSPSLPDNIPALSAYPANVTQYAWDFLVSGNAFFPGFGGCSTGGTGSGTAYWDVLIQGAKSETPWIYVQPAPLRITATAWVDPDGPAGPLLAVPMGTTAGGAAGYYYYMGQESIDATFIFTNTSTLYTFDVQPDIAVGGFDATAFMMIQGPTPSAALLLAPGQSATVVWAFTRTPGGTLDSCAPSVIGNVATFTAAARGAAATQSVEVSDVPFRPFDAVPLGTTPGTRFLTFDIPSTAPLGSFTMNLYATNTENRDFILDAAASFYLSTSSFGGSVSWTSSPAPPPLAWNAGQTRTLSWVYSADVPGEVRVQAGLDFKSVPPPCQIACRKGTAQPTYCNSTDGFYPTGRMFVIIPGSFSTSLFTAGPPVSCNDNGQTVLVQLGIRNTSSIYCAVVTQFCDNNFPDSFPIGYANPYANAPAPYPAFASPQPPLPFTIPANGTQLVTWYMDASCPPTPGGVLSFGCFSKTYRMVEGYTVNCKTLGVINPADGADWGGTAPAVTITQPAYLSCSIWTDKMECSVGQTITVYFSVSNEGGDDLTTFGVGTWPTTFLGAAVGPAVGPVPAPPAVYTGSNACTSPPPFASNQTFTWQFQTLSKGKVVFTATAMGWDAGCGTWKMTTCQTPVIKIASSAQLACGPPQATPVVTMSVSCTGCPPESGCDRVTGSGCLNVSMDLSNFGDIPVGNVAVSLSGAPPALRTCIPVGSCVSGSAILEPGMPIQPPTPLGTLASGTAVWRYAPAGLGCLQVHVEAFGNDNATGVTLYCDGWTTCAQIRARFPMGLSLVGVPNQIAPGQEFPVQVKVCNPGDTPASLQSGEPAFQFFLAATGAKVTDQYDVLPPPPVLLQSGECRTIDVTVVAHRNAESGPVEIRVAQGSQFVAMDAATGLPFPAVDTGGAVTTRLISLQNKLVVENNPAKILKEMAVLSYQIADPGRQGGRTTLRIYTITGDLVRTLVDKPAVIEEKSVPWDGRNDAGQRCASGVYLARIESPTFSKVAKVAILK